MIHIVADRHHLAVMYAEANSLMPGTWRYSFLLEHFSGGGEIIILRGNRDTSAIERRYPEAKIVNENHS